MSVSDSQGIPVNGAKIDVLTARNSNGYYITTEEGSISDPINGHP